jgi:hypothetical protein
MGLRTFTPIPGLPVAPNGGTPSLFYLAPSGGAVVTTLRIANPVSGATAALRIWRQPVGSSPAVPVPSTSPALIFASSITAGTSAEIRNIFMNAGDTLYALVDVAGPIISGDAASGA